MILAIDVGNSHVVLGSIEDGKILNVIRIKTDPKDTWAEYAIKIDQLFGIFGFSSMLVTRPCSSKATTPKRSGSLT